MTHIEFIKTMIEEKGISLDTEVQEAGEPIITVKSLLDFLQLVPDETKKTIKETFSKIDFKNGDIMHYIKFIAKGMNNAINETT